MVTNVTGNGSGESTTQKGRRVRRWTVSGQPAAARSNEKMPFLPSAHVNRRNDGTGGKFVREVLRESERKQDTGNGGTSNYNRRPCQRRGKRKRE